MSENLLKIKITADSTCDLSPELISKLGITISPLTVSMNGADYHDGVDITPADIFRHVENGGELCSTAAVNVQEYIDMFKKFSGEYDAVIHINIGSDFSSSHQNALIASEQFTNVYPIDSRNLSAGQGHIVLEACRMAENCADIKTVLSELNNLTARVEASFLLDRLEYMAKGGRCSSIIALSANLLQLKPCIEVIDGKMKVVKKYRGKYEKCLQNYVRDRLKNRGDIAFDTLFITHTPVKPNEMTTVKSAVSSFANFKNVYDTDAGCTVSCHCGPGTLGVLFIRKKK